MNDVTQILSQIELGDPSAAEQLLPLVYNELRKLAAAKLAHELPGQTLQATALVHEAYLRLVDVEKVQHWHSRGHFFAAAAEAMRRILVEQARKRCRREDIRGLRISLEDMASAASCPNEHLLLLNDCLEKLETRNAEAAAIVKLRFFGGLTMKQTADALGIPLRTAERNWTYARAWLHRELEQSTTEGHTDDA
ncbi:MAG TPA: ECF-type sigma factor [Lacipirellulaceae bacterium]|jgi:RNA polymerase sigma factor (TIGR02999 family)|nr:ECF-type sigma factor [Lacipirellulaceae bacterium]